ncbi:MAG: TraB/GumN family protein [Sulfuricaulis sp.]|uniref:TraB/GumN family protein n=1 Tax=Sulfuricaulis sp. TaxID=2003553 RepID=UPI0034A2BFB3
MRSADIQSATARHATGGAPIFTKILPILLTAFALFAGTAISGAHAENQTRVTSPAPVARSGIPSQFTQGVLWKISAPGVKSSYLFGTMHSDDARIADLPPPVTRAFDASDRFAMEALIDADGLIYMAQAMFFNDGRTLEQVIGKELFAKSVEAMTTHGVPTVAVEKQKPWAVMMALSMPRPKTGEFLDLILEQRAKRLNKPVAGLETIEEQVAVFNDLPLPDQVVLLKETVRSHPQFETEIEKMVIAYLARDLVGLEKISGKNSLEDDRVFHTVMDRLFTQRNYRMVERMRPLLKQGGSFIAVGVAHLTGEHGLLNLVKQAGYRVTPVY